MGIDRRVSVVTVFAPRFEEYPDSAKYLPLLELQRKSVERMPNHHHVVMSDKPLAELGFNTILCELPQSLMKLILCAQIAFLEQWDNLHPVVLVDVDCLVNRGLYEVFEMRDFDIALTARDNKVSPINNGAMYVAVGAKRFALKFFNMALAQCEDHWGGDQEAISRVAAPVPRDPTTEYRHGGRVRFLPMLRYNTIPKGEGEVHRKNDPFIIHFKGVECKPWMATYAKMMGIV